MTLIQVRKLDLSGAVTRRYTGREVRRTRHCIVIEAAFQIDAAEMTVLDSVLKRGDRFVETYYDDRYYNIFKVFDRDDGGLKGWYCNLSRPARIAGNDVSWVDLALDLWAWPDRRTALLDEEEFSALLLDDAERRRVWAAVRRLERRFRHAQRPP